MPNEARQIACYLTAAVLALSVVAGGSSQYAMMTTALAEMASLPLLGLELWLAVQRFDRTAAWPMTILVLGMAIGAVQLVPLSPVIWTALPGRHAVLLALQAAGARTPGPMPMALDSAGAARGLASLLPACAIFLSVRSLNTEWRVKLLYLASALAVVSVVLGGAQATGYVPSLYSVTNPGSAVGFFANRNHFAALLYAVMPLAIAAALLPHQARSPFQRTMGALGMAATAVLFGGICISASRAGLALGLLALVGGGLLAGSMPARGRVGARLALICALGFVLLLGAFQFSRFGLLAQTKIGPLDEGRIGVASTTMQTSKQYFPVGSGLGTFPSVFSSSEPAETMTSEYYNHAHNDWVEIWLEGSLAMALEIGAFLAWLVTVTYRWWTLQPGATTGDILLARGASLTLFLLLIHSSVDYPLRTVTLQVIFAFACALLIPSRPPNPASPGKKSGNLEREAR
jgi:hypothetical protein